MFGAEADSAGEFVVLTRQLMAVREQAREPTGGGGVATVEEEA